MKLSCRLSDNGACRGGRVCGQTRLLLSKALRAMGIVVGAGGARERRLCEGAREVAWWGVPLGGEARSGWYAKVSGWRSEPGSEKAV